MLIGSVGHAARPGAAGGEWCMSNPQNSDHVENKSDERDERDNRPDPKDELADEWGEESFPASDPPGAS